MTRAANDPDRLDASRSAGVEVLIVADDNDGRLSLAAARRALGERGVTRLLVEGGGHLAAGLMRAGLVDRLIWFRAARVIGGDGTPAVTGFGLEHLAAAPDFTRISVEAVGEDVVETYVRNH